MIIIIIIIISSSLIAKITAELANNNMAAIQQIAVVRTTAVGQTESTGGRVGSDARIRL